MSQKIVEVCKKQNCEVKPFSVEIGGKTTTFCCEKGFKQSIEDFTKTIKTIKQ